jgi:hypothetical protein
MRRSRSGAGGGFFDAVAFILGLGYGWAALVDDPVLGRFPSNFVLVLLI